MFPIPKISKDQWDKFLKDPEIVTLEILFVFLTLLNTFVLYRILLDVCPFPLILTWAQLLIAFLFAFVFGAASEEFRRCSYFPPFSFDFSLYKSLGLPCLIYIGMITLANVLLNLIPSIATFPVVLSLAVVLHHVSRFLGCGQIYLPIRWIALAVMLLGFLIGLFDSRTIGIALFLPALAYGLCTSIFRAWCLEKAMHVVEGHGNILHNQQVILGLIVLPIPALIKEEAAVFRWMPTDFTALFTWQSWGTLVMAGTFPFIKNVIANRLIRRTGQAPWRILEAVSVVLIFIVGASVWDTISVISVIAFILVLAGRILAGMDALAKNPDERRKATRGHDGQTKPSSKEGGQGMDEDEVGVDTEARKQVSIAETEAQHSSPLPSLVLGAYDPTGLSDSVYHTDKISATIIDNLVRKIGDNDNQEHDIEMIQKTSKYHSHYATRPLLIIDTHPEVSFN